MDNMICLHKFVKTGTNFLLPAGVLPESWQVSTYVYLKTSHPLNTIMRVTMVWSQEQLGARHHHLLTSSGACCILYQL